MIVPREEYNQVGITIQGDNTLRGDWIRGGSITKEAECTNPVNAAGEGEGVTLAS